MGLSSEYPLCPCTFWNKIFWRPFFPWPHFAVDPSAFARSAHALMGHWLVLYYIIFYNRPADLLFSDVLCRNSLLCRLKSRSNVPQIQGLFSIIICNKVGPLEQKPKNAQYQKRKSPFDLRWNDALGFHPAGKPERGIGWKPTKKHYKWTLGTANSIYSGYGNITMLIVRCLIFK